MYAQLMRLGTLKAPWGGGDVPMPGTTLWRICKDTALGEIVLPKGFECEGRVSSVLSTVANVIPCGYRNGMILRQRDEKHLDGTGIGRGGRVPILRAR
jgi:hypothetical protein